MATYTPAKRATAMIFYAGLPSQASTGTFQSNPTLAAGDFKVSIDGGALANLATLPAVTPASSKMVKFSLSAAEMTGDNITIICSDAAGAEWYDVIMNIQTAARQFDDLAYPATSGRSMVVDAAGLVDANTVKLGPTGSGTAQTAKDVGGAVPAVAAGASGGILISGSNAGTTTLAALTVTGSTTMSDGLIVNRSTSNASAIVATGNGTGHGISATSGAGATGDGIFAASGATNGNGFTADGNGTGAGINLIAGATGNGLKAAGGGTSGDAIITSATSGHGATFAGGGTTKHGVNAVGGATTSAGIAATGGATSGDGILITTPTLGHGAVITGAGASKHGMQLTSGTSTGNGLKVIGGSSSGDGINVTTTSGHGINLAPVGTNMHGFLSTGGNGGVSDGIKAVAGTGGVDIRGNITGNLVGTLSTLTTYTGNIPQTGDAFARIGVAGVGLTNLGDTRIANLDATVSSRSTLTQTQVTGGAYSIQSASAVLGDARIANLDAAVTSRMASYTQPTGFLAATFPVLVASTTNITAGTITTATNLTNAPTAGDFTATMKTSLNAATPAVTVSDKTGFSLTAAYDAAKTASSATALATAQADLDVLTGVDGATLATLQPNYAPAKASDIPTASIAAIKAKTDNLTFTVAGQVDANAESMNATTINGTGIAADLWRGA